MSILQASRPEVGQIAFVRQRRYLVESVTAPDNSSDSILVELSCLDDDAQGDLLTVLWDHELDARVLTDAGWSAVANQEFDDPNLFAAYLRTLSWNCVTATDPIFFNRLSGLAFAWMPTNWSRCAKPCSSLGSTYSSPMMLVSGKPLKLV